MVHVSLGGTEAWRRIAIICVVFLLTCAGAAQAATVTVTTTGDPAGPGNCPTTCSLRQAVVAANPGDTVAVPAGTYALTQGTISIAKNLTIQGAGQTSTTIDGQTNVGSGTQPNRIFKTTSGTITFSALTLTHGGDSNDETCSGGCNTLTATGGGAVFNSGATLTIQNVAFTDNLGGGTPLGGAIANSATLTLTDDSFTNNSAAFGGAIFNHSSGSITGTGVTFNSNGDGSFGGGAIYLDGGTASLTNATFTNNGWASSRAGGIKNVGATLTLTNDTLSRDIRGSLETDTGASTTVINTLLGSDFSDGVDFTCVASGIPDSDGHTSAAAITSEGSVGHNLDQDGHCALNGDHDVSSVDPQLAPLADNGGPTKTMALLHGSAAIDGGASGSCPANDQRGIARTEGTTCDIGAFEARKLGAPTATTNAATNVAGTTATFHGTINLQGEAGAYHFIYGTSPSTLDHSTPAVGAGVISSDTPGSFDVTGLSPTTTYYVEAVADDATGTHADTGSTIHFTTTAAPPTITQPTSSNLYDTHALIGARINPNGADTHWEVDYGTQPGPPYDHQTSSTDMGTGTTDRDVSRTINGLQPNTTYYFVVKASNSAGAPVTSGELSFTTASQLTGTEGNPVTFTSDQGCPNHNQVNWGDGTTTTGTCIDHGEAGQSLSADHTYAEPGHYDITVGDPGDPRAFGGAQIADAPLTATGVSATATTLTAFSGAVATFADGNHHATAADFTATIDWGDGQQTPGTVTNDSPGQFTVSGTHLYKWAASQSVTVSISDVDRSTDPAIAHSTITTSTPPPTPAVHLASLVGGVKLYVPQLPFGYRDTEPADPGARVRVDIAVRGSRFTRSTTANSDAVYSFTGLPACNPAAGDHCTVSVLDPAGQVLDARTVTLPAQVRRVEQPLEAGRLSDRFLIQGKVRPPGELAGSPGHDGGGPTPNLNTKLTISVVMPGGRLRQIYDAAHVCREGAWSRLLRSACDSSTGGYLLANVRPPVTKDPAGTPAVITLLEARPGDPYVAVDSARFRLPASTPAHDADPPVTDAPDLHTVLPVPSHPGGHTVGGRVTLLRPFMPTLAFFEAPGAPGREVSLTDRTGKTLAHTLTDRHGDYAFTNVAGCRRCTIHVRDTHQAALTADTKSFTLPATSPSVTVVDLTSGPVANRFFVEGGISSLPGDPSLDLDLTISVRGPGHTLTKIYDALGVCRHGGWGPVDRPSCATGVGGYRIDHVPNAGRGSTKPRRAVLTLLERNDNGDFVAVDSVPITLPADTPPNNRNPQLIRAPDLHAVYPAPAKQLGRTVTGFVEWFQPELPGAQPGPDHAPAGTTIRVVAVTREGRVSKTTKLRSDGTFSVTDLPACPKDNKDMCTASVLGPGGVVEDTVPFNLSNDTPSSVSVNLVDGLLPVSPTVKGAVSRLGSSVPTDLQISVDRGGSSVVIYDALNACRRGGGWLVPPHGPTTGPDACRGGFGDFALGSVPSAEQVIKDPKGPVRATLTLLEQGSDGRFTPVDSTDIFLPLARGVTDGLRLQVNAGTLFG